MIASPTSDDRASTSATCGQRSPSRTMTTARLPNVQRKLEVQQRIIQHLSGSSSGSSRELDDLERKVEKLSQLERQLDSQEREIDSLQRELEQLSRRIK